MTDDLDRDLKQIFTAAAAPLAADDFIPRLELRVGSQRRIRTVLRLAAFMALFLAGAFAAHTLVRVSVLATEGFGELLISPLGWTLSLLLAVGVMRRGRLLRH